MSLIMQPWAIPFDQETAEQLDELRSFRHVFRNMYRKNLDPEKLLLLQKRLPRAVGSWRSGVEGFVTLLKEL